jgi:hypothetical protein
MLEVGRLRAMSSLVPFEHNTGGYFYSYSRQHSETVRGAAKKERPWVQYNSNRPWDFLGLGLGATCNLRTLLATHPHPAALGKASAFTI